MNAETADTHEGSAVGKLLSFLSTLLPFYFIISYPNQPWRYIMIEEKIFFFNISFDNFCYILFCFSPCEFPFLSESTIATEFRRIIQKSLQLYRHFITHMCNLNSI